jgi:predicted ArsR family transcriptional regulator
VGLHLNTVRAHLNVLREAGLVGVRSLPSAGPGRPRLAFAATEMVVDEGRPGAFRLLAGILTASLQERHDGPERSTSAGRAAGRQLAERPHPRQLGVTDQRAGVFALLDRLGFAPRPAGEVWPDGAQVIGLHRCPFSDLAEDGSSIVCAAHRGLIEGAFEELGGSPGSVRLTPFASPGLCTVHFDQS